MVLCIAQLQVEISCYELRAVSLATSIDMLFFWLADPKGKEADMTVQSYFSFKISNRDERGQIRMPTGSNLLNRAVYCLLSFECWASLGFAWVFGVVKLKTRFLERILALLTKDLHLITFDLCFKTERSIQWVKEPGWGLVRRVVALPPGWWVSIYLCRQTRNCNK